MWASHAWMFFALATALSWGLGYTISERVMQGGVSGTVLIAVYYAIGVPVFVLMATASGQMKPSLEALLTNRETLIYFLIMTVSYIIGNYCIYKGIFLKNASLVNLIEISYPVFTVMFSWILFKEFHLTSSTIAGAVLIFCGLGLIFLKS